MPTILTRPEPVRLRPELPVGHSIVDVYRPGVLVRLSRQSETTFTVELLQNVNAFTSSAVGLQSTVWLDQFGPAWIIDHVEPTGIATDGRRKSLADALASAVTGTYLRGVRGGLW